MTPNPTSLRSHLHRPPCMHREHFHIPLPNMAECLRSLMTFSHWLTVEQDLRLALESCTNKAYHSIVY